ncbi:MAG: DNA adenine methylase, partial [Erysipelotrichales bacterium]|nr:DNA adenine methylase [Erysipelotrichales bacterium]
INMCYLSNRTDFPEKQYYKIKKEYFDNIETNLIKGVISSNYAPVDDKNIQPGERVFYTTRNAKYIDTAISVIKKLPEEVAVFFLAPLLYEASVKNNTAGMFKGFYKDSKTGLGKYGGTGEYALKRIKGNIEILEPIFSNFDCKVSVFQEDSNYLSKELKDVDITYIDPPYNQHPYGSNYFMLNAIIDGELKSEISKVSGIPKNWNRSAFNVKSNALSTLEDIIIHLDTKYFIISYNSEGFIGFDEMKTMLEKYGDLKINEIPYNTYRGSRNLSERNLYVDEYLFVLKKTT